MDKAPASPQVYPQPASGLRIEVCWGHWRNRLPWPRPFHRADIPCRLCFRHPRLPATARSRLRSMASRPTVWLRCRSPPSPACQCWPMAGPARSGICSRLQATPPMGGSCASATSPECTASAQECCLARSSCRAASAGMRARRWRGARSRSPATPATGSPPA